MDKIKGQIGLDTTTLMCLCVVFLVGIASFGLGRLSISQTENTSNLSLKSKEMDIIKNEGDITASVINTSEGNHPLLNKERMYVASKNGKLYYTSSCSGAKRILPKNEVWFANISEAEKAGYTLSSSCK